MDTYRTKAIQRVLFYIEEHIQSNLEVSLLARLAGYSDSHFLHLFTYEVGMPLHHYIRTIRLKKAAERLQKTSDSITEIGFDACYETPSAFAKAFKQKLGLSPQAYRMASRMCISFVELQALPVLTIRECGNYYKAGCVAGEKLNRYLANHSTNKNHMRFFGILHDDPNKVKEAELRYDASVLAETIPTCSLSPYTLQSGLYIEITHQGYYRGLIETMCKFSRLMSHMIDESRVPFCEFKETQFLKRAPEKLVTKLYIPLTEKQCLRF